MKTLVLGLGNDLLSDDAIGVVAARELRKRFEGQMDIIDCNLAGMALLDVLMGNDRVIIIDAINSGKYPPGTIIEMGIEDLRPIPGMSPHYAGLPEVVSIGKKLEFPLPKDIIILAIEIRNPLTIGGELSKPVAASLEKLLIRIREHLHTCNKCLTEKNASLF